MAENRTVFAHIEVTEIGEGKTQLAVKSNIKTEHIPEFLMNVMAQMLTTDVEDEEVEDNNAVQ